MDDRLATMGQRSERKDPSPAECALLWPGTERVIHRPANSLSPAARAADDGNGLYDSTRLKEKIGAIPSLRENGSGPVRRGRKRPANESHSIQAVLAGIGAAMGMKIWIPKADRGEVLREWGGGAALLNNLPLSYDEQTLRTIEQIDVLWLKGHAIVRAFEVEHTTTVYSGLLRMADLLALQPNMEIKLHIVAPDARRKKVFRELTRPVFSLFEKGPLAKMCTYISYSNLRRLAAEKHLAHLADSVLEEFAEKAE